MNGTDTPRERDRSLLWLRLRLLQLRSQRLAYENRGLIIATTVAILVALLTIYGVTG